MARKSRKISVIQGPCLELCIEYHKVGFHAAVDAFKRRIIESALEHTEGNQSRAAELLGLQRTFLSRLLKRMKLR